MGGFCCHVLGAGARVGALTVYRTGGVYQLTAEFLGEPPIASLLQWSLHVSPNRPRHKLDTGRRVYKSPIVSGNFIINDVCHRWLCDRQDFDQNKTKKKKQIWYIRESVERRSCATLRKGHLRTQPFKRLRHAQFLSALWVAVSSPWL